MLSKLMVLGVVATSLAFGQRGGGGGGGGGRGGGGGAEMGGMPMGVKTRFERITEALTLNKEQKKEVKAMLDDAQKEAAPVHDQLVKSRLAIGEAIQGSKSQDEINQLIASHAALESQMVAIELSSFAKIYQGLDKDQQTRSAPVFVMMKGIFSGKNWNSTE
jgi:hypothetical protein